MTATAFITILFLYPAAYQKQATDLKFERADKYHQERHWWKCDSCSHMWAEITGPVLEIRDRPGHAL